MTIIEHDGKRPVIDEGAYIFDGVKVIGEVKIGAGVSLWYNSVIRGDINSVEIGENTNIQDGTVIHVDHDYPTIIGADVTVGHGAIIHGCRLEDNCLIGMGAALLNGCRIGEGAIVAAGALVRENFEVPPRMLVAGVPAKVRREVSDEEYGAILKSAEGYVENAGRQRK